MGEWPEGTCPRPLSALRNSPSTPALKLQNTQDWTGEAALSSRSHQDDLGPLNVHRSCLHPRVARVYTQYREQSHSCQGGKPHNVVL